MSPADATVTTRDGPDGADSEKLISLTNAASDTEVNTITTGGEDEDEVHLRWMTEAQAMVRSRACTLLG